MKNLIIIILFTIIVTFNIHQYNRGEYLHKVHNNMGNYYKLIEKEYYNITENMKENIHDKK